MELVENRAVQQPRHAHLGDRKIADLDNILARHGDAHPCGKQLFDRLIGIGFQK